MAEETTRYSRRTVLKTSGAATLATTGFAAAAGTAAAADCSGSEVSTPQDTDFTVWLHAAPNADQNGKLSDYATYLENEFNDHVDDFNLSATVYDTDLTKSDIRDHSQDDKPFYAFADYIRDTLYSGDWSGEQGSIDVYMYDSSEWSDTIGAGAMYTSGAYDGASHKSNHNPYPVAVASGSSNGDAGCRIKHELTHGFFYEGTDEYGYNQADHKIMNVSNGGSCSNGVDCRELGDLSGNLIDHAYSYGWVYSGGPDCAYNCTG